MKGSIKILEGKVEEEKERTRKRKNESIIPGDLISWKNKCSRENIRVSFRN